MARPISGVLALLPVVPVWGGLAPGVIVGSAENTLVIVGSAENTLYFGLSLGCGRGVPPFGSFRLLGLLAKGPKEAFPNYIKPARNNNGELARGWNLEHKIYSPEKPTILRCACTARPARVPP